MGVLQRLMAGAFPIRLQPNLVESKRTHARVTEDRQPEPSQ